MEEKQNKNVEYGLKEEPSTPVEETPTKEVDTEPKKQKKSKKSCIIALLVLFFLVLLLVGAIYWSYRKVSKAMGPVDLEVEYTVEDYHNIMEELGVDIDGSLLCMDCPTPSFLDPNEVEVTVSNAQASAAFEYINQYVSVVQISDTQIKMGEGNAELSTTLSFQGQSFPVYMVGSVSKASENSLNGAVTVLKVSGFDIPVSAIPFIESALLNIANQKLVSAGDTVRIDSLEITPDGINFKGLVPTKAE